MADRIKLTVPGRLPGLNEYVAANRQASYIGNRMKQDAQNLIITFIKLQLHGIRITEPVVLHFKWVEPNRKRDLDNIAFAKKFIQDALVKTGVLHNDGWKQIAGFTDEFDVDPKHPHIELIIEVIKSE